MAQQMNWLDIEAGLAALFWQIRGHVESARDDINYDRATSFCTDCPRGWRDTSKSDCCKDTGVWDENEQPFIDSLDRMDALKLSIAAVVSPEALQAAKDAFTGKK